jgi:hypothetical protein
MSSTGRDKDRNPYRHSLRGNSLQTLAKIIRYRDTRQDYPLQRHSPRLSVIETLARIIRYRDTRQDYPLETLAKIIRYICRDTRQDYPL